MVLNLNSGYDNINVLLHHKARCGSKYFFLFLFGRPCVKRDLIVCAKKHDLFQYVKSLHCVITVFSCRILFLFLSSLSLGDGWLLYCCFTSTVNI